MIPTIQKGAFSKAPFCMQESEKGRPSLFRKEIGISPKSTKRSEEICEKIAKNLKKVLDKKIES